MVEDVEKAVHRLKRSSVRENPDGVKGVVAEESKGVDGGATWHFDTQSLAEICWLNGDEDVKEKYVYL
ncbi:hypothetical protein Tco_1358026 [Tanacetum coccineum]